MAIDAYGNYSATGIAPEKEVVKVYDENPKGILGKDDFLTLMLVQMQHQDPTEPMDAEKILSQTSELAGLEAATNTNKALEELTASLANSQDFSAQFSTIGAIGKMADTGSDGIVLDETGSAGFEVYFPTDVKHGTIEVADGNGNVVRNIDLEENDSGTFRFDWDGLSDAGSRVEPGIYHVNSSYIDSTDTARTTRLGAYPISSVRFENGEAQARLGSSYVPFSSIVEVYEAQ